MLHLFKTSKNEALIFVILLSSLVDSNFYVRHLYPYDFCLCSWFLIWLYFHKYKNLFISGIFIVLITLIYPAYWPIALLSIVLFLYGDGYRFYTVSNPFSAHFKLLLGGLLLVITTALVGFYAGHSMLEKTFEAGNAYLYDLFIPFDGSIILLCKYYINLDNALGIFILLASSISFFVILYNFFTAKEINNYTLIAIVIFISLVFDEFYGRHTGQKMLYARMCKQYSPLLILLIFYLYKKLNSRLKYLFYFLCFILSATNLIKFYLDFKPLAYPRDILSQCIISTSAGFEHDILTTSEDTSIVRYNDYISQVHYSIPPQSKNALFIPDSSIYVNFSYPSQVRLRWNPPFDTTGYNCILSKRHFFSYNLYAFDCGNYNDNLEMQKNLRLKIFTNK